MHRQLFQCGWSRAGPDGDHQEVRDGLRNIRRRANYQEHYKYTENTFKIQYELPKTIEEPVCQTLFLRPSVHRRVAGPCRYFNAEGVVLDQGKIIKKYVMGWFLIDLLATFPSRMHHGA